MHLRLTDTQSLTHAEARSAGASGADERCEHLYNGVISSTGLQQGAPTHPFWMLLLLWVYIIHSLDTLIRNNDIASRAMFSQISVIAAGMSNRPSPRIHLYRWKRGVSSHDDKAQGRLPRYFFMDENVQQLITDSESLRIYFLSLPVSSALRLSLSLSLSEMDWVGLLIDISLLTSRTDETECVETRQRRGFGKQEAVL